jgi:hypothetical protein
MADADLRALERRWLESRSIEDEERWHAARLRAGLVTERGLVIAAGLGHEAATRLAPAVGLTPLELFDRPQAEPHPPTDSARVRAAIGVANAMVARMVELVPTDPSRRREVEEQIASVRVATSAAQRWARCPCPGHAEGLTSLAEAGINDCVPDCCWYAADFPGQLVGLALDAIAACAGRSPRNGWNFPDAASMFDHYAGADASARGTPVEGLQRAAEEAIRAAVLPWALGLSDPLHDAP